MVKFLHGKYGFTLSEVLITLGLLGTIAALTIPTLAYNYRGKVLEQQFRATYSDIKEIGSRINSEKGDVGTYANKVTLKQWTDTILSFMPGGGAYDSSVNYGTDTNITTKMREIYKTAGGGEGPYRFDMSSGKTKGSVFCNNNGIWIDSKNRIWTFNSESRIVCVDINGTAAPNTYNIDIFAFIPMTARQVGIFVYGEDNPDKYSGQIIPCDADKIVAKNLSDKKWDEDNPEKGSGSALDACPFMEPVENIAVVEEGEDTGKSAKGRKVTRSDTYWIDYINYK